MTTEQPLVSCIMPTANRREFLAMAIDNFLLQDYPNAELIIVDDGIESNADLIPDEPFIQYFYTDPIGTIGIKRNFACEKAKGEYILHWDDDDWYANDWISHTVNALLTSGADITGLNKVIFDSAASNMRLDCEMKNTDKPWVCGATMAYKKSLWKKYPFLNMHIGEDTDFLTNSGGSVYAMNYTEGFVARLHPNNTSIKYLKQMGSKRWTSK